MSWQTENARANGDAEGARRLEREERDRRTREEENRAR